LPLPNRVFDALVEIQQHLAKKGTELVLFGDPAIRQHYPSLIVIDTPFFVAEVGRRYSSYMSAVPSPQSSLPIAELTAIDRAWGLKLPDIEAELLTIRANAFWEKAFAVMQPSAILSWGATAPMARMMFNIARRFQRPAFVIERGLLEDTISYSLVGQGMLSNFNTSLSLVDPDLYDPDISEAWERIQSYYDSITGRHYPDMNQDPDEVALAHFSEDAHPRILYLGSHDVGSGASFNHEILGDLQGTWVKNSSEGSQVLQKALAELDFGGSLWIKPHGAAQFETPLTENKYSTAIMSTTDVYSLISNADICVTLTSSTQILSLIKGKPVVTLGNGQFTGRDIFYEASSYPALIDSLKQAITEKTWSERLKRGRVLLAAGYRETHIGLTSSAPTKFTLLNFSELIARFYLYAPQGLPSASERIANFVDFCASAFETRADRDDLGSKNPFTILKEKDDVIESNNKEINSLICEISELKKSIELKSNDINRLSDIISTKNECLEKVEAQRQEIIRNFELMRFSILEERVLSEELIFQNHRGKEQVSELEAIISKLSAEHAESNASLLTIENLLKNVEAEMNVKEAVWHDEKVTLLMALRKFLELSVLSCGRLPGLRWRKLKELESNLMSSEVFDENWYRSTYLANEEVGRPIRHFIERGLHLGMAPNKVLK
jgi:hypothetical protein